MEVSAKELRFQSGRIIEQVSRGNEVIVTYRGKRMARIVPIAKAKPETIDKQKDEIFGLWKDRGTTESVEEHVRRLRRGRKF